jgi:acyl phosphate:glycerol-3-phosphate acyltransferase
MDLTIFALAGLILLAYLLGSVPTAVWAGKCFYGIDLREHGSGNAGATNAFRVLGKRTALAVLVVDILKGVGAIGLSLFVADLFTDAEWYKVYQYGLGLVALLGHVFPVFAGFRGGKGIATLTGIVIMLFPEAVLICLSAFLVVFIITRYVSLGSVLASLIFPIVVLFISDNPLLAEIIFSFVVAVFVPLTHRKNIKRLIQGNENKISFKKH